MAKIASIAILAIAFYRYLAGFYPRLDAVGLAGSSLLSIAAMLSIFAALNGSILFGSRVPYAMARDGYFFAAIARGHPRFHTPGAGILLLGVWSSLLLLSGQFRELYTLVIFP